MTWKVKGEEEAKEVYETFQGHLYFVTDKEENGERFGYVRLYHMPEMAEWGYFNMNHLKEAYGENKIWKVTKKNWQNINSYEDGLLVEVEDDEN